MSDHVLASLLDMAYCMFISSPSKSALYGGVLERLFNIVRSVIIPLLTPRDSVEKLCEALIKIAQNQEKANSLEYGIRRTRWLIILILCKLGCRLNRTKLYRASPFSPGNSYGAPSLTLRPSNASPQSNHTAEKHLPFGCIVNRFAPQYHEQHIELRDNSADHFVRALADRQYCMASLK